MKKDIRAVIIVLAVLAFGVVGSYYYVYLYQEASRAEQPAVATTTDDIVDTSDWAVYENEEYGFRFRYPDTLADQTFGVSMQRNTVEVGGQNYDYAYFLVSPYDALRNEYNNEGLFGVGIMITPEGGGQALLEKRLARKSPVSTTDISLDGVPAMQLTLLNVRGDVYYAAKSGQVLNIGIGHGPESITHLWPDGIHTDIEMFEVILSTFEFI